MKCKGKKRDGAACKKDAAGGREFCLAHHKNRPMGQDHWNYKNGSRSKYIPARLAEKYAESLADPDLLQFKHDAALLQTRLHELLESGESELLWSKAQGAFRDLRQALAAGDTAGISASLAALDSLINRGMADALRWADIYRVVEQAGKTKEREHKRLVQMELVSTNEQVLAMLGIIADAARRSITRKEDFIEFAKVLDSFGTVLPGATADAGH